MREFPDCSLLGDKLRIFSDGYGNGTAKKLAEDLGITPQQLQKYFKGTQKPGAELLGKLSALGCSSDWLLNDDDLIGTSSLSSKILPSLIPSLGPDIADALEATRRTPASFARQLHTTPEELESWMSGTTAPSYEQLAALLHLVVPVALAHCNHGAQRPESVPPQPVQAVA